MTATARMSRAEILALPTSISLAQLARVLDRSEPTVRALARSGELQQLGIRINKLGSKWSAVTSSVWDYLGIGQPEDGGAR